MDNPKLNNADLSAELRLYVEPHPAPLSSQRGGTVSQGMYWSNRVSSTMRNRESNKWQDSSHEKGKVHAPNDPMSSPTRPRVNDMPV